MSSFSIKKKPCFICISLSLCMIVDFLPFSEKQKITMAAVFADYAKVQFLLFLPLKSVRYFPIWLGLLQPPVMMCNLILFYVNFVSRSMIRFTAGTVGISEKFNGLRCLLCNMEHVNYKL